MFKQRTVVVAPIGLKFVMKLQCAYKFSLHHCIIIAQHCTRKFMAMASLLCQYSPSNVSGQITLKSNQILIYLTLCIILTLR